ncbi:unnamed protein product [Gongylonema pulchrum]|uniref:Ovule protein n=1 Tax=Gongylonema pulchrum TaxID=637853 RepID=A0A183DGS5_9BILA|nr:unnamed protein product [Gongylonema pulchrum]
MVSVKISIRMASMVGASTARVKSELFGIGSWKRATSLVAHWILIFRKFISLSTVNQPQDYSKISILMAIFFLSCHYQLK